MADEAESSCALLHLDRVPHSGNSAPDRLSSRYHSLLPNRTRLESRLVLIEPLPLHPVDLAVNAISARRGGGVRHLTPFLNGMLYATSAETITAFVPRGFDKRLVDPNVAIVEVAVPPGLNSRRLVWDQVQFPGRARSATIAISPLNIGSLTIKPPHVLFERNTLYFDRVYLDQCPWRLRTSLAAQRALVLASMRAADRIIVPSNALARMITGWGAFACKTVVIPHGASIPSMIHAAGNPNPDDERMGEWRRHDIRLLNVGDGLHHKNLPILADIVAHMRSKGIDVSLAVTVDRHDRSPSTAGLVERVKQMGLRDFVYFLGPVSQEAVFALYRDASVFVLPSLTESFGFPLLEAIACGTPIVAADIAAAREVAGPFATFYPPNDTMSAVAAVESASTENSLSDFAHRRHYLEQFSWDRHCRAVAGVLNDLLA